jgi:hypothetical protein
LTEGERNNRESYVSDASVPRRFEYEGFESGLNSFDGSSSPEKGFKKF